MSIEVQGVEVRFGGVVALNDVSLTLPPGKIVAVIGPNGSGKSTLFNTVTGLVKLASGTVVVDGTDLEGLPPFRRIRLGVGRTFQTPRFDPAITVEEAVLCGFYPVRSASLAAILLGLRSAGREETRLRAKCHAILADLGLDQYSDKPLSELPMGHVRLVEVARAIANQPRYLLLDEPAAGLTAAEQGRLATEIKRLAASGVGILLVEHNFGMIRNLADHVVVLNRGRELCRGEVGSVERMPVFIETYLGASGRPA
jgi:ABC-type branched-subunit amino acid transport system ATPase component